MQVFQYHLMKFVWQVSLLPLGRGADSCSAVALSLAITKHSCQCLIRQRILPHVSQVSHWTSLNVESPRPLSSTSSALLTELLQWVMFKKKVTCSAEILVCLYLATFARISWSSIWLAKQNGCQTSATNTCLWCIGSNLMIAIFKRIMMIVYTLM